MSKDLETLKGRLGHINKTPLEEALDRLYECNDDDYTLGYQQHDYKLLQEALQRLEAIDNAKPSEALVYVEDLRIENDALIDLKDTTGYDADTQRIYVGRLKDKEKEINTIKQALLKSQEQEKENELLKEIIKSFFDRGCPLHQYTDREGVLQIEVDDECSIMHLGKYKGIDLDEKLKEVLK